MKTDSLHFFGLYTPGSSRLHTLDARVKLLLGLLIVVLALLSQATRFQLAMSVLLFALILTVRPGFRSVIRLATPLVMIVGITMLFHLLFANKSGEVLTKIFGIEITKGAVDSGLLYSFRVVTFYLTAYLIMATVSPSELANGITRFFRPLRSIGVPVQDFALILFMSMRFVPLLYTEFTTIKYAQQVRGVRFAGSRMARVRQLSSIVQPLLTSVTQRADETALALRARGYTNSGTRTNYDAQTMNVSDWGMLVVGLMIVGGVFYTTYVRG